MTRFAMTEEQKLKMEILKGHFGSYFIRMLSAAKQEFAAQRPHVLLTDVTVGEVVDFLYDKVERTR